MPTVFRIENAEGLGPYRHSFASEFHAARAAIEDSGFNYYDYHKNLPPPYGDGIPVNGLKDWHVCGFESLEQLLAWFVPEILNRLESLGFMVCAFEACEVFYGKHQVVFDRDSAVKVDCLTP